MYGQGWGRSVSEFLYQIQIGYECFIVIKNEPSYEFIGEVILKINIV